MHKTAIECHNEEEWRSCLAINGGTLSSNFNIYQGKGENSSYCMNLDGKSHCPTSWYIDEDYIIIQASDYIYGKPTVNKNYSIF